MPEAQIQSAYQNEELSYTEDAEVPFNSVDAFTERTETALAIYNNLMNTMARPVMDLLLNKIESFPNVYKTKLQNLEELATDYAGMTFKSTKLSGEYTYSAIYKNGILSEEYDTFYYMIPQLSSPGLELALATWIFKDLKDIVFYAPSDWKSIVPSFESSVAVMSDGEITDDKVKGLLTTIDASIQPDVKIQMTNCVLTSSHQLDTFKKIQLPLKIFLRTEYYLDIIANNSITIIDRNINKDFQVIKDAMMHIKAASQATYENSIIVGILHDYVQGDSDGLFKFTQMCNLMIKLTGDVFSRIMEKLVTTLDGTLDKTKITFD